MEFLPPVGTDAELAAFYGSLDALAHANDTGESFGLVIAEAMACGLPVVTHPCPGERDNAQLDLVQDGVTGFVAVVIFLTILVVGFAYEWKKGALNWE